MSDYRGYEEGQVNEIQLLDEGGKEVNFDHLLTFYHEQEKYIALLPLDEIQNVGEDEVVLLHVITKDDNDVYETIENEVLLEEVFSTFLELFEEILEQED
ncbi:MAG TPA: DUF1292 domain-containing protein [Clostridia bacterium]|nr:DUF1292 domain-containing protein [Clostridia bacterium]HOR13739.1 DUF1292 domain-containing protein [Clostridia bacterium]